MGADWLQGVFVSKIYQCYGYNETARSRFFIAGEDDDHGGGVAGRRTNRFPSGFLSSGLLGTFFGPLADKFGRTRASLMYDMLLPYFYNRKPV